MQAHLFGVWGWGRAAQPPQEPLLPIPQRWEVARADPPHSGDGHFPDTAWPILNKNAIMNIVLLRVKHSSAPNIHCIKTLTNPLGSHLWPHFTQKKREDLRPTACLDLNTNLRQPSSLVPPQSTAQ